MIGLRRKSPTSNVFTICRGLRELFDIGKYEDAIELIKSLAIKGEYFPIRMLFDGSWAYLELSYKPKPLIHKILTSELDESKKIDLLNEIYRVIKEYVKDLEEWHEKYQSDILGDIAIEIAWYSLRDKVVERAKKLEEKGYIEKATELYEFAEILNTS